jgi:hypothetical protein
VETQTADLAKVSSPLPSQEIASSMNAAPTNAFLTNQIVNEVPQKIEYSTTVSPPPTLKMSGHDFAQSQIDDARVKSTKLKLIHFSLCRRKSITISIKPRKKRPKASSTLDADLDV